MSKLFSNVTVISVLFNFVHTSRLPKIVFNAIDDFNSKPLLAFYSMPNAFNLKNNRKEKKTLRNMNWFFCAVKS